MPAVVWDNELLHKKPKLGHRYEDFVNRSDWMPKPSYFDQIARQNSFLRSKERNRSQGEQTKNANRTAYDMVQSPNMDEESTEYGTKPIEYPDKAIESLHFDYTFEQVTADLIDNSIDAGASHVEVILDSQDMGPEKKEYDMGMQGPNKLYCIVLDDGKVSGPFRG